MGDHDPEDDDQKPTAHYRVATSADEDDAPTSNYEAQEPEPEELPTAIHVDVNEVLAGLAAQAAEDKVGAAGYVEEEEEGGTAAYDRPAWAVLQDAEGAAEETDDAPTVFDQVQQIDVVEDLEPANFPVIANPFAPDEPEYDETIPEEVPKHLIPHAPDFAPPPPAFEQARSDPPTMPATPLAGVLRAPPPTTPKRPTAPTTPTAPAASPASPASSTPQAAPMPPWAGTPPPEAPIGEEPLTDIDAFPPKHGRLKKVLTALFLFALFGIAAAVGFVLGPFGTSPDSSDAGAEGLAASNAGAPDAQPSDATASADDGAPAGDAADAAVGDGADASLDGGASDGAVDAAATDGVADVGPGSDAGFVIEDPEIPPNVRRMRVGARNRRARQRRRVALRLHARMRYARAEEAWREALVYDPDNRFTAQGLARTLRALDRGAEADAWEARATAMRR